MATTKNPFGLSVAQYQKELDRFARQYPNWEWTINTNYPHENGAWVLHLYSRKNHLQATHRITDLEQKLPLGIILDHFMSKMPLKGKI